MLEEIFTMLFGGDLVKSLGINIRFLFFNLFFEKIKMEDLSGKLNKKDPETFYRLFNQNVYNLIVGYGSLLLLIYVLGSLLML